MTSYIIYAVFLTCLYRHVQVSWAPQSLSVSSSKFTDQDYADDAVLFSDCPSKWPYILSSFDEAAHTMGLNTSWSKTKIQNLGHGVTPAPVQLQGHVVESTDRFTYLGSDIHSSERFTPEIFRRIGLASNIFGRLANIWKRTGLSLQTKIRLYDALVISILLFGSETWTLLKADERRLEAFHMNCQQRIL